MHQLRSVVVTPFCTGSGPMFRTNGTFRNNIRIFLSFQSFNQDRMPNAGCTNVQKIQYNTECQIQTAETCRKFSIILNAKCRPYKLQYGVVSAPPFQSLQLIAEARVCSPFSIKSGYNDQMFQEHQSDVCATKNQNFSF